ncbi:hypothetical protein J4437_00020 [Candidatus Woesearchaeota archaeon]|nr:hypothetical protein [Candidatus Woesearchaeota archaeon]
MRQDTPIKNNISVYVIELFPKNDLQDKSALITTIGTATMGVSNYYIASVNDVAKSLIELGFKISPLNFGTEDFIGRKALVRMNYSGDSCPTEENIRSVVDKKIISGLDYVVRKLR